MTHAGQIDVFLKKGEDYDKLDSIAIRDLLPAPSDLSACARLKRLYISDLEIDVVMTIEPPYSGKECFRHFAKVIKPQGLSVSPDGRVVVATGLPYSVYLFNCDGSQNRHVSLTKTMIEDPYQVILVEEDNLIVCSGLYAEHKQSISKMSIDGVVLVSECNGRQYMGIMGL